MWSFSKVTIFQIPLSITFSNPKILGSFFYPKKNQLNLGTSEMQKIKLEKIIGNLLDKLWKLYLNGTDI